MMEIQPCTFCASVNLVDDRPIWDESLRRYAGVNVTPTRGSLLAGWVLIVPHEHELAAAYLSEDRRRVLIRAIDDVRRHTQRLYGNASVFEHGPSASGSSVGCSVDHVHIHVAPLPFDLARAAKGTLTGRNLTWVLHSTWSEVWDIYHGTDYVAASSTDGIWAATGTIGSQFFRRVIAAELGVPDRFDWRRDTGVYNIRSTVAAWRHDLPHSAINLEPVISEVP